MNKSTITSGTSGEIHRLKAPEMQTLQRQIESLTALVANLAEEQRRQRELRDEIGPIVKEAMGVVTERLDEFEKKGYFDFGREGLGIVDRVVTSYEAKDVKELGDNIILILDTVKAATQPGLVEIVNKTANAVYRADTKKPKGLFGMLKASSDKDVRRGMSVMLEVLRQVGKGARRLAHKKRLHAIAPRARRALPAPAPAAVTARPVQAQVCAQQAPVERLTIPGIPLNEDGFLADPDAWDRDMALSIAAAISITMTESHWKAVDFARADFMERGVSPNVRRVSRGSGVTTKELYTLFPAKPGIAVARIAGIPKPKGCL